MTTMRKITRTIYGSKLQTEQLLGLPFEFVPNTTLNEKFDVQAGVQPEPGVVPRLRYYGIGIGGHRHANGADGHPYVSAIQHDVTDAALYRQVPFLLRTPDNDLDATTRQKYAMRKAIVVNGTNYIAYYLKLLDFQDTEIQMLHNAVADGVTTSTPFVPTAANLNPTATNIPTNGVVTTDGDYTSSSATVRLNMSATDVEELVNVCEIMFDNAEYAVVSEIALVAACPKLVTASGTSGTFNYNEAIVATIVSHITAYYAVVYNNDGFDFRLEIGGTEALFGIDPP